MFSVKAGIVSAGLSTCVITIASAAYSGLLERSPFLSNEKTEVKQVVHTPSPSNETHFVLKGVSKIGTDYRFSIHDKRTKQAIWIKPNEVVNGFSIVSYDPSSQTVVFKWGNQNASLQLIDADEQPIVVNIVSHSEVQTHTTPAYSQRSSRGSYVRRVLPEGIRGAIHTSHQQSNLDSVIYFNGGVSGRSSRVTETEPKQTTGQAVKEDPLFATDDQNMIEAVQEDTVEKPQVAYQVSRRNTVENPTGKRPDYRNYAGLP